jgi:hypothetical protein
VQRRNNARHACRTRHELRAIFWQVCERDVAAERRQRSVRHEHAEHAVAARAAGGDAITAVAQLRHAADSAQQRPRGGAGAQQPRRKHRRTRSRRHDSQQREALEEGGGRAALRLRISLCAPPTLHSRCCPRAPRPLSPCSAHASACAALAAASRRLAPASMAAAVQRALPNILITGTPGTGKTTTAEAVAAALGLTHVDVGKAIREQELHSGWDEKFECHIVDEDKARGAADAQQARDAAARHVAVPGRHLDNRVGAAAVVPHARCCCGAASRAGQRSRNRH